MRRQRATHIRQKPQSPSKTPRGRAGGFATRRTDRTSRVYATNVLRTGGTVRGHLAPAGNGGLEESGNKSLTVSCLTGDPETGPIGNQPCNHSPANGGNRNERCLDTNPDEAGCGGAAASAGLRRLRSGARRVRRRSSDRRPNLPPAGIRVVRARRPAG